MFKYIEKANDIELTFSEKKYQIMISPMDNPILGFVQAVIKINLEEKSEHYQHNEPDYHYIKFLKKGNLVNVEFGYSMEDHNFEPYKLTEKFYELGQIKLPQLNAETIKLANDFIKHFNKNSDDYQCNAKMFQLNETQIEIDKLTTITFEINKNGDHDEYYEYWHEAFHLVLNKVPEFGHYIKLLELRKSQLENDDSSTYAICDILARFISYSFSIRGEIEPTKKIFYLLENLSSQLNHYGNDQMYEDIWVMKHLEKELIKIYPKNYSYDSNQWGFPRIVSSSEDYWNKLY